MMKDTVSDMRRHIWPEDTSSITEETAASSQEVSAATEEQVSSMNQIAITAQEVALVADGLLEQVNRFVLVDSETYDMEN